MTTADIDRTAPSSGPGAELGLAGPDDRVGEAVRPGERRVARRRPGRGPQRDVRTRCS